MMYDGDENHTKKMTTKKRVENFVYIFISLLLLAHKTTVRLTSHLKKFE